jgi:sugar fermentation stimulation protein A
MKLSQPLIKGTLIKRYKRFLVDVALADEIVTAHCPNSGSMTGVSTPGSKVVLSCSNNPKRKLKYAPELVKADGIWVGVNTNHPNKLVQEAIEQNILLEIAGYATIRREVKYGQNSRIDLLLESAGEKCYVEVKNMTLRRTGTALFPDAVTKRGQKHLRELMNIVREGRRLCFFLWCKEEIVGN